MVNKTSQAHKDKYLMMYFISELSETNIFFFFFHILLINVSNLVLPYVSTMMYYFLQQTLKQYDYGLKSSKLLAKVNFWPLQWIITDICYGD